MAGMSVFSLGDGAEFFPSEIQARLSSCFEIIDSVKKITGSFKRKGNILAM